MHRNQKESDGSASRVDRQHQSSTNATSDYAHPVHLSPVPEDVLELKNLELVNRKVLLPPLGLVTVAALLPGVEMKLADRNVREVTEAEWNWAELVVIQE